MIRPTILCFAVATWVVACSSTGPELHLGPEAVRSPDGLYKVDNVPDGVLFTRSDYVFGSYEKFLLAETSIAHKQDSHPLTDREIEDVKEIFDSVARATIQETGREEVTEPAACVAIVQLSLIDLEISPDHGRIAAASPDAPIGLVTLVMEIRDGYTNGPLMRYGDRRVLRGAGLEFAFQRMAKSFQRDFGHSLPSPESIPRAIDCTERARTVSPASASGSAAPASEGQ